LFNADGILHAAHHRTDNRRIGALFLDAGNQSVLQFEIKARRKEDPNFSALQGRFMRLTRRAIFWRRRRAGIG